MSDHRTSTVNRLIARFSERLHCSPTEFRLRIVMGLQTLVFDDVLAASYATVDDDTSLGTTDGEMKQLVRGLQVLESLSHAVMVDLASALHLLKPEQLNILRFAVAQRESCSQLQWVTGNSCSGEALLLALGLEVSRDLQKGLMFGKGRVEDLLGPEVAAECGGSFSRYCEALLEAESTSLRSR